MFEDSLIESGGRLKTKRGATTFSFFLQVLPDRRAGPDAAAVHRSFTEAAADDLPGGTAASAAATAAAGRSSDQSGQAVQSDIVNGQLRTPTKIPEKVQMIKEEEAPPPVSSWWRGGRRSGGVPGGQWAASLAALSVQPRWRCLRLRLHSACACPRVCPQAC